ncbi:MAG: GNAT family N-acetyltransferase, partial [Anaerolineae bacterium]|nr:GNAT family N-acetyltransferase [Anaerolineae bacterium]
MPVTIRELQKKDLPQVKTIFREFVQYHQHRDHIFEKISAADKMWGQYVYESHLQDVHCKVLVAELEGSIVGYCMGRIVEKPPIYQAKLIGQVDNIAVKEGYKRQGIGEKLFAAMKVWFKEHNV